MSNRRNLLIALGASTLAVMILIGFVIWSSYREAIQGAQITTQNYAAMIEARLDATLHRTDALLENLARTMPLAALNEPAVDRYANEINSQLDSRRFNFLELANLRIFSADGVNLYSADSSRLPSVNIANRSYFRQLRDNPRRGVLFSEVVIGYIRNKPTMLAARALQDGNGTFRGVVVATIDFDYFQKLFQAVQMGPHGYLGIHRTDDFTVVLRQPQRSGPLNTPLPVGHPARERVERGDKTATEMRIFSSDGIHRISSFQVLGHYPFFVTVAVANQDVLSGWTTRSLAVGLSGLLLLIIFAALLYRLLEAERRQISFAAIVENSNDAIIGRDLERTLTSWNPAAERMFGWTAAEAIGQKSRILLPPDIADNMTAHRLQLNADRPVVNQDTVRFTKDGRRIPVSIAQSPIKDASGTLIGFSVIYRDITERKHGEAGQARLAAIVEGSNDAIISRTLSGAIDSWNAGAERLFGWTEAEALGTGIVLSPPERKDEVAQNILGISQGLWLVVDDTERVAKDGRRIPVSLAQSPIKDANGNVVGASTIYRDITELKRTQAMLQSAKVAADQANHAKSRFLAAASHDLRQPLAAATLYLDMLTRAPAADNRQLLVRVKECVDSLSDLLNNLFEISRLDAGVISVQPTDFAISSLYSALDNIYSPEAARKSIQLRFRQSDIWVRTDNHLLKRLLGNLVSNAIHFTSKGGVLVACRRHANKLWLEVWDTGIGMADDKSNFIFEEFTQLGDPARNDGSGLGLAIVAKTAALLGLRIRWHSRHGRGSMFAVELPSEAKSTPPADAAAAQAKRHFRIGLVEDNRLILDALNFALSSKGHEVVASANGNGLLEMLAGTAPDIILSDYRLAGGENGYDVIVRLRRIFGKPLPAIIFTGDTDKDLAQSLSAKGIKVLYKPVQIDALELAMWQLPNAHE